jgi:hypothetical protein
MRDMQDSDGASWFLSFSQGVKRRGRTQECCVVYNENIRRKFEMFSNTPVEVFVCSVVE